MTQRPTEKRRAKRGRRIVRATARWIFAGLCLLFGVVVGLEIVDRTMVVEEVSVPEQLAGQGYTSSVVAYRLLDEFREINQRATTTRRREQVNLGLPPVEVSLPVGASASLTSIVNYVRARFGYPQTRLRGGIVMSDSHDGQCAVEGCYTFYVNIDGRSSYFFSTTLPRSKIEDLISVSAREAVARLDPYLLANYYYASTDQQEPHRIELARALANIALQAPPRDDDVWAYTLLGMLDNRDKNWQAAISYFDLVLAQQPQFAPALNSRCWAKAHIDGRVQDAIGDCRAALTLDATSYESFDSLAFALDRAGRRERAFLASRCARQINPHSSDVIATYNRLLALLPHADTRAPSTEMCTSLYKA